MLLLMREANAIPACAGMTEWEVQGCGSLQTAVENANDRSLRVPNAHL